MIKKFLWIGLLTFGMQVSHAFSLLGPTGNGDDARQVLAIGYGVNIVIGDLGSAKNLGEEYRLQHCRWYITPTMLIFSIISGSNGVVAVDNATAIMNALTNVDSYDFTDQNGTNLFPFDTRGK